MQINRGDVKTGKEYFVVNFYGEENDGKPFPCIFKDQTDIWRNDDERIIFPTIEEAQQYTEAREARQRSISLEKP